MHFLIRSSFFIEDLENTECVPSASLDGTGKRTARHSGNAIACEFYFVSPPLYAVRRWIFDSPPEKKCENVPSNGQLGQEGLDEARRARLQGVPGG